MQKIKTLLWFSFLFLVASPAFAQHVAATDEGLSFEMIAGLVVAVVVPLFSLISAFIPDEKMPTWLEKLVNLLAMNVGKAKNAQGQ